MELEVEGRMPVGRLKRTWKKLVGEDMRKLNITEDMAKDRKQWRQLISHQMMMMRCKVGPFLIGKVQLKKHTLHICVVSVPKVQSKTI